MHGAVCVCSRAQDAGVRACVLSVPADPASPGEAGARCFVTGQKSTCVSARLSVCACVRERERDAGVLAYALDVFADAALLSDSLLSPWHAQITNASLTQTGDSLVSPAGSHADSSLLFSAYKERPRSLPQYSPVGGLSRALDRTHEMKFEDLEVPCAKRSPPDPAGAASSDHSNGCSRRESSGGGEKESLYNRIIQVLYAPTQTRSGSSRGMTWPPVGALTLTAFCSRRQPSPSRARQKACSGPQIPRPRPAPLLSRTWKSFWTPASGFRDGALSRPQLAWRQ